MMRTSREMKASEYRREGEATFGSLPYRGSVVDEGRVDDGSDDTVNLHLWNHKPYA
jgi:hypothetical protein